MKQFFTWTVRCLSVFFLGLAIVVTLAEHFRSFLPVLLALVFLAAIFLYGKKREWLSSRRRTEASIPYEALTAVLFCATVAVVLLCGSRLAVNHSWDWGQVLSDAIRYTDDGIIPAASYYARYPNNQFMFRILVYAFRLFRLVFPDLPSTKLNTFSILLSCAMILLAYLIIYQTVKEKYGRKYMFFCAIAILLYTPSYLYATFAYTDTFSFPLNAAVVYLYARRTNLPSEDPASRRKSYILLALIGILGGIGARFKIFSLIYLIAVLVSELTFSKPGSRMLSLLVSAAILIGTAVPVYLFPSNADMFDYDQTTYDQYRFPYEHWVMMGLKGEGGYNGEDVQYTKSFTSYEEKKEAAKQVIRQRVQEKGAAGLIKHVFYTKIARAWGTPTLLADDYVSRNSLHEEGLLRNIFGWYGKYYSYYSAYQSAVHLLLLVFLLINALFRTRQPLYFFTTTTILGMFLFLSIWECNSRYLYSLIPCFLINGLEGSRILSHCFIRYKP